jgi:hypothetical protein
VFFISLLVLAILQIKVSSDIAYPPTEEQLAIIFSIFKFLSPQVAFLLVKLLSLMLVGLSLFYFWTIVKRFWGEKVATLSAVLVFLSPTTYAIWNLHPVDSLKTILVMLLFGVIIQLRTRISMVFAVFGVVMLLTALSHNQPWTNIPIFNSLNLKAAGEEIMDRLYSESKIVNRIEIPLAIKRISYNKFFFIYKNVVGELIKFGDPESLFFQEVHPLEQKSFVLFFWPEIIFFTLGIYFATRQSTNSQRRVIFTLLAISLVDFLVQGKPAYQRFWLTMFPLSIIVALGISMITKRTILTVLSVGILTMSYVINYQDILIRPDYWFDNRPLVYQFIFNTVRMDNNKIQVTTLVGNPGDYCKFYITDCPADKFIFNSFNLKENVPENKYVYAGFVGEFLGPDIKNNFSASWKSDIESKSIQIINSYKTRDSIAYRYGDWVVVGEKK